jgi:hypothetical protein
MELNELEMAFLGGLDQIEWARTPSGRPETDRPSMALHGHWLTTLPLHGNFEAFEPALTGIVRRHGALTSAKKILAHNILKV